MAHPLLILLILSTFPLHPHLSSAADSISENQSLSGEQKLTSKGSKFVLGFFPLGNSPKRYYIGIWYNTDPVSIFTPVWVANRDTPVLDSSSSELKLSKDGNLVLLNQSKSQIWSTETNITSKSTIAVLLDSGNLVLQDGSDASRVLWQSFDHPTHTWLPGAKLGLNKLTGENQHQIAWRSTEDHAQGPCPGTEKDKFYQMDSVRLPANPQSTEAGSSSECKSACLNNCSCTAYSYSSKCSLWFGNLLNIQEKYSGADQSTIFLRLAASELPSSSSKKGGIIGAAIGGAIGFLALLAIIWFIICRQKRRRIIGAAKAAADGILVAFRYSDLQYVTRNFSEKLGSGAFGSVYKGVLSDATFVAVKKLINLNQGEKQFRAEVSTIGTIQHINLIRLRGFCADQNSKCLVYEFMPNSSLDAHLFHVSKTDLDWGKRYLIALGTARGLVYLHEKCRDCIIHCDIKPENILLDASFIPKVADFGLAKLVGRDLSRVLTTMRGTIGYLAPEWISGVAITAKADVYSYGMMLFEIISGKRNADHWEDNKTEFFPASAMKKLMTGDVISLLDPRLEGDAGIEEVERACKVACWCIQDEEVSRPTMGQVVQMLEGIIEISMPPVPKLLQVYFGQQERIVFFSDSTVSPSDQTQTTFASAQVKEGVQILQV